MNIDNKKKVISVVEERYNCKLDDLSKIKEKIYKNYNYKFSTKRIYGQNSFSDICQNTFIKEKDSYWTLAEKFFKRQNDMLLVKVYLEDEQIKKEYEYASELEAVIEKLVPLEILWAMEEEYEDGYTFTEYEQECYDYLVDIATYFLRETEQFEKLYEEIKTKTKKSNSGSSKVKKQLRTKN